MPAKKTRSQDPNSNPSSAMKVRKTRSTSSRRSARNSKTETSANIDNRPPIDAIIGATDLAERIAKRAYELHQQRGYQHGYDFEDWLEAEREILSHSHL